MENENKLLKEKIKELEKENLSLKEQQIEVSVAKKLYLKILDDFPALIWRSRLDKLCDYFNNTWLEFTGRTMEQEFGNGWAEGVHPDDFDFCLKTYVNAFDKREAFKMEYRMKNNIGEYRWILDIGRPFYDLDNTFLGYIGSCYDITENKNNELSLIELNATKDKFFSIISHDLRNPFHGFLGLTELMADSTEKFSPEEFAENSKLLNEAARHLYKLLENLLEWAQMQKGSISYVPKEINLSTTISQNIEIINQRALQKGITIINEVPETQTVFADQKMIDSVLRNLLSNAVKFTRAGGKVIVKSTKSNNGTIEVSVADDGIGINENDVKRLFKIEEKISTLGTDGETSTGLGLLLCKEFIDMHGGKIWVESEINKGSIFYFTIHVPLLIPAIKKKYDFLLTQKM